jgi:succinoglycan biosynthesis protein ExoM
MRHKDANAPFRPNATHQTKEIVYLPGWSSIDICVCTFRRPSLALTLRSIAAQVVSGPISLRVIVADNDDSPSARALTEEICAECDMSFLYLHAPARNISIARNMCISRADAPLIAFIDDDEQAGSGWLAALMATLDDSGADIVFGPVVAIYDTAAPAWLRRADLHSIKPVIGAEGVIKTGYTSNVLLKRAVLHSVPGLRFAESLGRSGGEDTVFFHDLYEAGARLAFSAAAVVTEAVPAERGRMSWLVRRAFRMGQTHARILNKGIKPGNFVNRLPAIGLAAAKSATCLGGAVLGAGPGGAWRRQCFRAAMHAGVVAKLFGLRDVSLY